MISVFATHSSRAHQYAPYGFEFTQFNVTISVEVKHFESQFEIAHRSCGKEQYTNNNPLIYVTSTM